MTKLSIQFDVSIMDQIMLEGYRIIELLSGSPGGRSYLGEDTDKSDLNQYVVKQFLPPSQDSKLLKISHDVLETEAKPLDNLAKEDDRIENLTNFFEKDKNFYLVRKFIIGKPLNKEIFPGRRLSSQQVLNLLLEVLEILVFIHSRGIIHRNLKPANIIRREYDGKLILTDFGTPQEAVSNIVASSEYMPIEQIHGNPQFNSDIYSLGIIAIEALTGLSASQIIAQNKQKNPSVEKIIWQRRGYKLNPKLVKIINQMVCINYQNRYQSAQQVLKDLKEIDLGSSHVVFQQIYQHVYQPLKQKLKQQLSKNIKLIAGIGSIIVVGAASWIIYTSRNINSARQIYQQGIAHYHKGKYEQAIKLFSQAIKINPEYSSAYNSRGDAYYRLRDYKKSQEDSSAAISHNPKDANAYYDRAFTLYSLGKYKDAIADYNRAIKLNPSDENAYYGRGLAHYEIKQKKQAIADVNQAIKINPKFAFAYVHRGRLHRERGEKIKAIQDFDKAIKLNPKYTEAYYQRGKTHYAVNDKLRAKKDFTKVIELDSQYVEAYIARGNVYSDLGYPKQAYQDYQKAIKINPNNPKAYIHRGKYRFKIQDIEGAIENYNQAIELDATQPTAYNNRGNAYLELGKLKEAMADYSKAIQLNPKYPWAYYNRGLVRTALKVVPDAIEDFQQAADIFLERGEDNNHKDALSRIRQLTR